MSSTGSFESPYGHVPDGLDFDDQPFAEGVVIKGQGPDRITIIPMREAVTPENAANQQAERRELEPMPGFTMSRRKFRQTFGHIISEDVARLAQPDPGRNAPCPCGSGKKYKHCHGAVAGG